MPNSYIDIPLLADTNEFLFTFPYLEANDIWVKYGSDVIPQNRTTVVTSPATAIHVFTDTSKDTDYDATAGMIVRVYRITDQTPARVDFVDGSVLTGNDLDTAVAQLLYISQESYDKATVSLQLDPADTDDRWDCEDKILGNLADAVQDQDAVTKTQLETTVGQGTLTPQLVHLDTDTDASYVDPNTECTIDLADGLITYINKRVICSIGGVIQRPDTDFKVDLVTPDSFKLTVVGENITVGGKLKYPVSIQIPF